MTLVKFEAARRALAEARSIDEVKEVRDRAEALRLYVKQQGDGLAMQNDIAEIKLRAERRAGELLREMGLESGNPQWSHDETIANPRLTDLGISKSQSSRWQLEAEVPEEVFERHVAKVKADKEELTSVGLRKLAKQWGEERARAGLVSVGATAQLPVDISIQTGDARQLSKSLAGESVDLVFTDPIYDRIDDYRWLAREAARVLKPGGTCIVQAAHYYLHLTLPAMAEHFEHLWVIAQVYPWAGGWHYKYDIQPGWKPYIWVWNGQRKGQRVFDRIMTYKGDKRYYVWGDTIEVALSYVESLTEPGDVVFDPFLGSGTTAVACCRLGRRCIGYEIDPNMANIARGRVVSEFRYPTDRGGEGK